MRDLPSAAEAEALAERMLAPLGDRWCHTRNVAERARGLIGTVAVEDRELLVVAAWWHDLGYASDLRGSVMHQLDGARYLTSEGYPDRLCRLVARHSAAIFESEEREVADELSTWVDERSPVRDALWAADMTTGPTGERVDHSERLNEVLRRYGPESVVARAMRRARPSIDAAIDRVRLRSGDSRF